ncbi:pyridoxamine 5'-phosphate oxidase family protein [Paraburkholderia silviterrae]|uniref:Pyridoxamine 5'-phosphate oxidase family protein n=1 Tax=Paraburkholderia silviterrae TaxID=2528715 RepID=A0A4R5M9L5_9BURK|nr:pyridoxamine 5'-phosphate oxidase family protein [Paraburkholderia silviterrae]TDG23316.1 pyridoxamine 5'-phosphate oxidase family protein [Paraburkholderia silviterrae]
MHRSDTRNPAQEGKHSGEQDDACALPPALVSALDGEHLEAHADEAMRLSTVSADGWPHGAQLSVGEVLAVDAQNLLVAMWPRSHTAQNMLRDARLTLTLVHDGAVLEIRARASLVAEHQTALDLSVFRLRIERVDVHRAKYAEVLSGVTFRLHEREKVLARWREQIAMLRTHL